MPADQIRQSSLEFFTAQILEKDWSSKQDLNT